MRNIKRFQFSVNSFNPGFLNYKTSIFRFSLLTFHLSLLTFYICLTGALAQDEPKDAAPPPLKILYKEEKAQLDIENDIKKRTKLALDLMEIRLKKAEDFNTQNNFEGMFTELGGFHALVDNTLSFLDKNDTGGGKVLNNFKRMELSLRTFIARLEVIRRELPLKYEFYVRGLVKQVRDARTKAVEPMFSDSIVSTEKASGN